MPTATVTCPDTGVAIPAWVDPESGTHFPVGALPTPRHLLAKAVPFFAPVGAAPPEHVGGRVPKFRSMFGNDRYGDCVSAEEAFTKTSVNPELFNSQSAVDQLSTVCIAWARSHGVLNGASLDYVLDSMYEKGFQLGPQLFNDGPKLAVDYSNVETLKAAIALGPVKLAIGSGALPGGAGSRDGAYALTSRNYSSDLSTTLLDYGTVEYCFGQLNLPVPSGIPAGTFGFLHYTWATIQFVTIEWIRGATDEAWLRNPTTVGVPPLAPPVPPTPPTPPPLTGVIYGQLIGSAITIQGEIKTQDGNTYIATPVGGGAYRFVPKAVL